MAWRERTRGERHGAERGVLDLRLDASDRLAGGGSARSAPAKRRQKSEGGKPPRRAGRGPLGKLIYWGAILSIWAVLAVVAFAGWHAARLPPIQSLELPKRPPAVQIVGLDGRPLATRGEMGGAAVSLKTLPTYLPQAFIAVEDRRFYSHHGVDIRGVGRAVMANVLRRGVAQGGSTLTQQLAKNLFLTQDRTMGRKVQELVLALWLEQKFSKDQILELYLNRVYFGAGAYGVEAAAQRYFGKPARSVTLAEAAMLAGLVKAPGRLAPTRNAEAAQRRAAVVLAAMGDAGYITPPMALAALAHPAEVAHRHDAGTLGYVADYVMDAIDDLIGHVEEDVTVVTTIDPVLQTAAERTLVDTLARDGEKLIIGQGALVAMDPEGAVRVLVGGRNYADSQFNRAITAKRQPGSAFKPFVYLAALERGLTPDTVRQDAPIDVKGWKPENYSRDYRGPVTLSTALALSLNTVAVRLGLEVGPRAVVAVARRLGIASKLEANASIALGTSEVSLLELTAAYAVFANGGLPVRPVIVERIKTAAGKTLYARRGDTRSHVIEPRHIAMLNSMLEETLTTGTARKAELPGWRAAGKTGTTQDFKDAWFIGYTSRLIAGVWLGNDDNTPTKKVSGSGAPVEIWSRFMREAHRGVLPTELPGRLPPGARPGQFTAPPPGGDPARPLSPEPQSLDRWLMDTLFGRR